MFNNKRIKTLEARIKSLEDLLGVGFSYEDEFADHNLKSSIDGYAYGALGKINERLNKLDPKKETK